MSEMKTLSGICNIKIVGEDTQFWFIRTDGGIFYENFVNNGFVAIGWGNVGNVINIKKSTRETLIEKIKKEYPDDQRPGYVYGQIKTFIHDIKIGDYILIPSKNSKDFTFGIIESEVYEESYLGEIDKYFKDGDVIRYRRKVSWIDTQSRSSVDPYLYRIIYSHNTIVNAEKYENNILRTLYDSYIFKDKLHGVIRISSKKDISALTFSQFISKALCQVEEISEQQITEENLNMKMSLNSPGMIEFATGSVLIAFAINLVINSLSGGKFKIDTKIISGEIETPGLLEAISKYKSNDNKISIKSTENELKVYKEKLKIEQKKVK